MRVLVWSALVLAGCTRPAGAEVAPAPSAGAWGVRLHGPAGTFEAGTLRLGMAGLSALDCLVGEAEAQEAVGRAAAAPLDVRADSLAFDGEAHTAVFTGSVMLTRGSARLTCDRLTATTDSAGQVLTAHAQGTVLFHRGALTVTAPSADLDLGRAEVVLSGPVRVERGGDVIEGDRVVVSMNRERVTVQGARGRLHLAGGGPS
jgi:lipopolysaccharide export system protein LptA